MLIIQLSLLESIFNFLEVFIKKKLLIIGLVLLLVFSFAACSNADGAEDTGADSNQPAADAGEDAESSYTWALSVNGNDITEAAGLETVTQTLQKQNKEGKLKEQGCTGFTVQSLLDSAGIGECTKVIVASSDGTEYELSAEAAALTTTMFILEQDGEVYELPRLGVEGEGSDAWVKDVVSITVE